MNASGQIDVQHNVLVEFVPKVCLGYIAGGVFARVRTGSRCSELGFDRELLVELSAMAILSVSFKGSGGDGRIK